MSGRVDEIPASQWREVPRDQRALFEVIAQTPFAARFRRHLLETGLKKENLNQFHAKTVRILSCRYPDNSPATSSDLFRCTR
jgi:hypothetical protein